MTDKIIIDGIDVTECKWINHWEHCAICNILIKTIKNPSGKFRTKCLTAEDLCCATFPDCHYKQLQRKIAECEELKIKLMQKDEVNAFFNTPIEGWSSDPCKICESKNEKIAYENEIEIYNQTCLDLKEELKEYEDILDSRQREWEEENERYIQALDDIEEYCNKYGQNSIGFRQNILEIIKKTKEGR